MDASGRFWRISLYSFSACTDQTHGKRLGSSLCSPSQVLITRSARRALLYRQIRPLIGFR
jgi:hypothetical protein